MATLSVVATVQASNVPPRVKLDITDSGTPAINSVTVTRTDPSGNVIPVRTDDGGPLTLVTSGSNRVGTLYDYLMPYGQSVTYSTTQQPASTSAAVTVPEGRIWLVHPGIPDRSTTIRVADWGSRTRRVSQGVFYPLGRADAVAITDGQRKNSAGVLTLRTDTDAQRAALDDVLSDASVLLLNVPPVSGTGVQTAYLAIGDVEEIRLVEYEREPARYWSLPYTVVAAPLGGSQAQWTWNNVLATGTWQQVLDTYGTWARVQAPTT